MDERWVKQGVRIDGASANVLFGYSVSLSGDGTRMAIGAPYQNNRRGVVRVYDLLDGTWAKVGSDIIGEPGGGGDLSGYSVSLSKDGTRVAIGAPDNDIWNTPGLGFYQASSAGHVRVYELDHYENSGLPYWRKVGLDIDKWGQPGLYGDQRSGSSVSLSKDGTWLAIGAPSKTKYATFYPGLVRVYHWLPGSTAADQWQQVGSDIYGHANYDHSGFSVSLSSNGTRVAIGAPYNDGNGNDSGHVRVYDWLGGNDWQGGNWQQVGSDINGKAAGDRSGFSVSLSSNGTRVAIGAPYNDGKGIDSGQVRVYDLLGGNWKQVGSDIYGELAGDLSGHSVSLSENGTRVAIGAPQNGDNPLHVGIVRVYDLLGGIWQKVGSNITGESSDRSGFSISLSSNGERVVVGAPYSDDNGNNSGHVRVYEYTTSATGVSSSDPYVNSMLSDIPVKLPDKEACYRLYQDGSTFVNAEVIKATPEHQERMKKHAKLFLADVNDVIVDGFFYSKFFITTDGDSLLFDLKTKKCFSSMQDKNEKFNIKTTRGMVGCEFGSDSVCGMACQHKISWTTKEGRLFRVVISFYDNPHIENGISVTVDRVSNKALGLCVKNYRPKLMTIPNILTGEYDKLQRRVTKSNDPFQQKLIKSKNEKWIFTQNDRRQSK